MEQNLEKARAAFQVSKEESFKAREEAQALKKETAQRRGNWYPFMINKESSTVICMRQLQRGKTWSSSYPRRKGRRRKPFELEKTISELEIVKKMMADYKEGEEKQ